MRSYNLARPANISRRAFLGGTAAGMVATPWLISAAEAPSSADAERQKIAAALPAAAFAKPRKPRTLLIFELNVNYGGHRSISTASTAFTMMGQKTGAFKTVVSKDPEIFKSDTLPQFDAVFFNNNVGNLFTDPELRQNLVDFIYGGGGLLGVHGTSVAFTQWPGAIEDWPEFGLMLGARGANHRANDERVFIKLDEPAHPVNQPFGGQGFEYRDEFFRVHEPYSRNRVRVLLSIDTEKTDLAQGPAYGKLERADNDYALAWVRQYGRGRAFYCTIAHNPYVFWDPKLLPFYLAAVQFALGDLPAPTAPSGKLTPAIRAQEQLGWRIGYASPPNATLFEAIDQATRNGVLYLSAAAQQQVSSDIAKPFDAQLTSEELRQIRFKLDAAGVRLVTYRVEKETFARLTANPPAIRNLFAFGRRMGIETIIAEPPPSALDEIEKLCDGFNLQFAIEDRTGQLNDLKIIQSRSQRLGLALNLARWPRSGINPIAAVRSLKDRLLALDLAPDHQQLGELLAEIHRQNLQPTMFGVEANAATAAITSFNQWSLELANRGSRQKR